MKIAHLINSMHTGGAENLITESVPVFKSQGLIVDVILLNGIETPFLAKLQATNCNIVSLSKSSVYNPFLIFKIIPLLKKYDLIHVHLFPALYWVAIAKLISFSNVKLVFTEHSTTNKRRSNCIFRLIDRLVYCSYSKIITISEAVDFAIKKHLRSNNFSFIQIDNGVNLKKIKAGVPYFNGEFVKTKSEMFIFQISSFQYPKDQKTVIKSLIYLPDDIKLFLVGDGILKLECEFFAKSLNLEGRVFFLGIRMDIPDLLKTADFIVLSSVYEGFSLSCVEGMAAGIPLIASDVPALRAIVQGAGLLFPLGNAKALAENIIKLNSDVDFYQQTAQSCLQRASEFDIETMIQKEIELYKSLLS